MALDAAAPRTMRLRVCMMGPVYCVEGAVFPGDPAGRASGQNLGWLYLHRRLLVQAAFSQDFLDIAYREDVEKARDARGQGELGSLMFVEYRDLINWQPGFRGQEGDDSLLVGLLVLPMAATANSVATNVPMTIRSAGQAFETRTTRSQMRSPNESSSSESTAIPCPLTCSVASASTISPPSRTSLKMSAESHMAPSIPSTWNGSWSTCRRRILPPVSFAMAMASDSPWAEVLLPSTGTRMRWYMGTPDGELIVGTVLTWSRSPLLRRLKVRRGSVPVPTRQRRSLGRTAAPCGDMPPNAPTADFLARRRHWLDASQLAPDGAS